MSRARATVVWPSPPRVCDRPETVAGHGVGAFNGGMAISYPAAAPLPPAPLAMPTPDLRIGDAERSAACDELAVHFAAGRLTEGELSERIESAARAQRAAELYALFHDLPRPGPRTPAAGRAPVGRGYGDATVAAGVIAAACTLTCFLMVAGSVLIAPPIAVFALIGGFHAAIGGGSIGWLLARRRIA